MAPRKYEQTTRAQAAEETRQRIVAATFALHDEQGIEATTMKQIAAKAGAVSVPFTIISQPMRIVFARAGNIQRS